MKVFISHQKDDIGIAQLIATELQKYKVESYLDVFDISVPKNNSEKLTGHIKRNLLDCTDVLVLMTLNTKKSWWVPFEIGLAEGNNIPVVTWLSINDELPAYLDFWPRVGTLSQLEKYVDLSEERLNKKRHLREQLMEGIENTDLYSMEDIQADFIEDEKNLNLEFYRDLKRNLRGY